MHVRCFISLTFIKHILKSTAYKQDNSCECFNTEKNEQNKTRKYILRGVF